MRRAMTAPPFPVSAHICPLHSSRGPFQEVFTALQVLKNSIVYGFHSPQFPLTLTAKHICLHCSCFRGPSWTGPTALEGLRRPRIVAVTRGLNILWYNHHRNAEHANAKSYEMLNRILQAPLSGAISAIIRRVSFVWFRFHGLLIWKLSAR